MRHNPRPGRIENHTIGWLLVPHRLADRFRARRIPQTRRAVLAHRGNACAVGTEYRIHDFVVVPHGLADLRAGGCIPHARCLIRAGRENTAAIRTEDRDVNLCLLLQHKRGHSVAISLTVNDRAPQIPRRHGILRIEPERSPKIRHALAPGAFAEEALRGCLIPLARAALRVFGLVWRSRRLREKSCNHG